MKKTIIDTDQAPKAIGPYSQAVVSENIMFTSGQLPIDPFTGKIVNGSIEERTHMVLKNIEAIAQKAGTGLDKVLKTTVYLTDINDFQAVNKIYAQYFKEPFPARSAFQVAALPLEANIEIEAIFKV